MEYINEFHKQWIERTRQSITSWSKQPASRRSKETAGEIEPTEGYKRRQINELIKFTNNRNLWVNLSCLTLTYMDKGGENEVFHDGKVSVIKLNNFENFSFALLYITSFSVMYLIR